MGHLGVNILERKALTRTLRGGVTARAEARPEFLFIRRKEDF